MTGRPDQTLELRVAPQLEAVPGTPAMLQVRYRCAGDAAHGALIRLIGLDPSWGPAEVHAPPTLPGEPSTVWVTVTVPKGTPAGRYPFVVAAQATDPQTGRPVESPVQADVVAVVASAAGLVASLPVAEPKAVWGRRIQVRLENRGPAKVPVRLEPAASSGVRVRVAQRDVEVPPGATAHVRARVSVSRSRAFGQTRRLPFALTVHSRQDPIRLEGFVRARPWIGRTGLKAGAFVTVIALWMGLGLVALDKIAGRDRGKDVALTQVTPAPTDDPGGSDGAGGPGKPAGSGEPGAPVGETDGEAAGGGERVSGKVSSAEPDGVTVSIEPTSLVDERIEGASFAGVAPMRPIGKVPMGLISYTPPSLVAPKRSTVTGTDGSWSFAGVRAPGYYLVTFSKPGYQTQRYVVEPKPGEDLDPLAVSLTAGYGHLAGRIDGPSGPLGGVSLTITDGTVTATTTTPTTGDVGSWSVDGLSTPGTYLVTASAPGFGTESRLVTLDAGASADGVDLRLQAGVATLVGKVSAPDETGAVDGIGGVTVSVTDGTTTRTATTVTTGPVGSYVLPQLPVPSVYTVTISGDGYAPRSQQVELTPDKPLATVDALLIPSTGTVTGTVLAPDRTGIVGAGLVLTGENGSYKTMSVSSPAGGFRMTGVAPGSYVLTASKFGHVTEYVTVNVEVGTPIDLPVTLTPIVGEGVPATSHIRGTVVDARTGGVITCDVSVGNEPCLVTVRTIDRSPDGDRTFEVTTAPEKPYVLPEAGGPSGLTPGLYTVSVSAPGYESATVQVQVPLGAIVDAAPVALHPSAVITGTLTAAVGTVPSGTCVVAVPYSGTGTPTPDCTPDEPKATCVSAATPHCALVDANGNYVIRHLDHGTYRVAILLPQSSEYVAPASADLALALSEVRRYDQRLNRLGRFVVTVLAPDANGSLSSVGADTPVTISPPSTLDGPWKTDDAGAVTVRGLQPGYYTVDVKKDTQGEFKLDSVAVGLNQDVPITAVLTSKVKGFRGRVVYRIDDDFMPVAGAKVTVSGITGYNGSDPRRETGSTTSDSDGCFLVAPADESYSPTKTPCDGSIRPTIPMGLRVPAVDLRVDASSMGFGTASLTGQSIIADELLSIELAPPGRAVTGKVTVVPQPTTPVDLSSATIEVINAAPGAGNVAIRVAEDGTLTWNDSRLASGLARPGTYRLRVSMPGYDPGEKSFKVEYAPAGSSAFDITGLTLKPYGGLTVHAFNAAGSPIPDAVFVLTGSNGSVTLAAPPGGNTVTFSKLSPDAGPYTVEARGAGYVFTTSQRTTVLPGEVYDLKMTLPRAGTITGQVQTSVAGQKSPLAGLTVTATNGTHTFTAVTDASGRYRITGTTSVQGLNDDDWTVSAQRAGYTTVGGPKLVAIKGWAEETCDFELKADPVTLTVVVQTDEKTPKAITDAQVTLTNDSLPAIPPIDGDTTGRYTFRNLAPTQYWLQVVAPNYSPVGQPITLEVGTAQQTIYIPLAARPNSVHGQVLAQRGTLPSQPLEAAVVTVLNTKGNTSVGSATTLADGTYQISGLVDGDYKVKFAADGYVDREIPINVKNGQVATVNATLTAVTYQLTVRVDSTSGVEMTGAIVSLTADDGSTGQSQADQRVAKTQGTIQTIFNQVLPGKYTITTSGPPGHIGGSATVTLSGNQSVTVTVTERRLSISVNASKASTSPTPIATIRVLDGDEEVMKGTVVASGKDTIQTFLSPGTYTIEATSGGYTTETKKITVGTENLVTTVSISEFGALTVTVVDKDNEPVEGATVNLDKGAPSAKTGADGKVTFKDLAPGKYTVEVDKVTQQVTVDAGKEATATVNLPDPPGDEG